MSSDAIGEAFHFLLLVLIIMYLINILSQQTRTICIAFVQCRTNVKDVGPKLRAFWGTAIHVT